MPCPYLQSLHTSFTNKKLYFKLLPNANYQLSTINYQLSTLNCDRN
ncbi:MAG: hypothetical protein ACRC62_34225 [Microcoleus sp.]